MRAWLFLASLPVLAALEDTYAEYATKLRKDLKANYDFVVPPRSNRMVNYSKAGTDVGLSIRFFKVQGVDASTGQIRLKVWVRMTWSDLRLSWEPAAYGNVSQMVFHAVDATDHEGTEIWVPDFSMYNSNTGTQSSLDAGNAVVYSDGTVFWSRPGLLDTLCKFSGLVAFPFDNLKCEMEWGGWAQSDGFQGLYLTGDGYVFATMEDTAGASYQEYSIKSVAVNLNQVEYAVAPAQPWTLVKYTIELNRASFYYDILILMPTILVTCLSFGVFFMSHEVGERLSFGITLLLVVEVMRGTVSSFVPICGELLWVDLFMMVNTVFCCFSLLETMTVLFFAFHTDEHLLPDWLSWLAPWIFCRTSTKLSAGSAPVESQAGAIYRRLSHGVLKEKLTTPVSKIAADIKGGKLSESDTAKLIFFENLFYMLDSDSNGLIHIEDACCMLSFVNLNMSRRDLRDFLEENFADRVRFTCSDFVEVCVELMWTMPFQEIKMGAENYISSYNRFTKLCANYWLEWSKTVDRWARFWLPMSYLIALGILFNLNLTDGYEEAGNLMFQGFGPSYMTVANVFRTLVMPFFAAICIFAWFYMRKFTKKKMAGKEAQIVPTPVDDEEQEQTKRPFVPRWSMNGKVLDVLEEEDA